MSNDSTWWVYELVQQLVKDADEIELELPRVAVWLRKQAGSTDRHELEAMKLALAWLVEYRPDLYSLVLDWAHGRVGHSLELSQAMVMLGQKIDEVMG